MYLPLYSLFLSIVYLAQVSVSEGTTLVITPFDKSILKEVEKAVIKADKQKYPDKEIDVVFKPHTFTRTRDFKDELIKSLGYADKAYLLDIFPAREKQEDFPDVKSENIVKELDNGKMLSDTDWEDLKKLKNAVVLFLSPKQIVIMNEYKEYLREINS